MSAQHISAALADMAWQQYEDASARASRFITGQQFDLLDTSHAEAREWLGIALDCEREAMRHGR